MAGGMAEGMVEVAPRLMTKVGHCQLLRKQFFVGMQDKYRSLDQLIN